MALIVKGAFINLQDGGKTWIKTLFINDLTGASEISMDLNNPNVLSCTSGTSKKTLESHFRRIW